MFAENKNLKPEERTENSFGLVTPYGDIDLDEHLFR